MEQKTKETRIAFPFQVSKANDLVVQDTLELPKRTRYVKGLQLVSDHPSKLYFRGSQRIEIGGEEIFPDGFDSKILMSLLNVAPRERFFDLGQVLAGDLLVKVRYRDQDHGNSSFGNGYRVSLILLLEEYIT